jgi:hypothetical protein
MANDAFEQIKLTPEEQAQLIPAGPPSAGSGFKQVNLSPSQVAALTPAGSPSAQPAPEGFEPAKMEELDEETLFKMAVESRGDFDPVGYFAANSDRLGGDQAAVTKFSNLRRRLSERGIGGFVPTEAPVIHQAIEGTKKLAKGDVAGAAGEAVEAVKEVGKPVGHFVKGVAKQFWNYSRALNPIEMTGRAVTGKPLIDAEGRRRIAENIAGTELAVSGLGTLAKKGLDKVTDAGRWWIGKELDQKQQEMRLWDEVGRRQQEELMAKGHGAILGSEYIGKHEIADLEKRGLPVRPEESSALAAGDPFSFWAFGKFFKGAHKVPLPTVSKALAAGEQIAGKAAQKAVGAGVKAAGKAVEVAGKGVKKAAPAAPLVTAAAAASGGAGLGGLAEAAVSGGVFGGAAGLGAGNVVKQSMLRLGARSQRWGEQLKGLGKKISTGVDAGDYATFARDVLAAAPKVASEMSKGGAIDLGLAVATSTSPLETRDAATLGTVFGFAHGAFRGAKQVISGQIVTPRPWHGVEREVIPGRNPGIERLHSEAYREAAPGVKVRVDGIRGMLRKMGASNNYYLMGNANRMVDALVQLGYSRERAADIARNQAIHIARAPGAAGEAGERVVLVRNTEAAPHESFHPIQDVIGEKANRVVDEATKNSYTPAEWEALGRDQAARFLGITAEELAKAGYDWREVILDVTNKGNKAAFDQILKDTAELYKLPLDSAENLQRANDVWNDMQVADGFRQVVRRPQRVELADQYLARELAAENWDAVLDNIGPSLQNRGTPTYVMAQLAAKFMSALGGEPLGERTSKEGTPLRYKVVQAAKEAGRGLLPDAPAKPVTGRPSVIPRGARTPAREPENREEAANEAREIAKEAPDTILEGAEQSQREILATAAELIAGDEGARYSYRSAPEAPGFALESQRTTRRAEIEAARNMPEDVRKMVDRTGFPYRITRNRQGIQLHDWSPDMAASNAYRWGKALGELAVKDPTNAALTRLPKDYTLDLATGEWTADGWRAIMRDAEIYGRNQALGYTGAGERLIVPEAVRAQGRFAPPEEGTPTVLDQARADIMNLFQSLRVPKTPRVTGERLPGNIVAQRVSEATLPGRVVEPAPLQKGGKLVERRAFGEEPDPRRAGESAAGPEHRSAGDDRDEPPAEPRAHRGHFS